MRSALLRIVVLALALDSSAVAALTVVQSVAASADTPTPTDNDFTRIDDAIQAATDGDTIELQGTFDWTEASAAASWALGSDGTASTGDDYSILVPGLDDLTVTAASLGAATIQGPGDLPGVDLEGFLVLTTDGGAVTFQDLTISNLRILDFDLAIGMFYSSGSTTAFNGAVITNNFIRIPNDVAGGFAGPTGEPFQNIGIHYSFGTNQTISSNVIEIPGDAASNSGGGETASVVAMQSNTSGGAVYEGLLIDGNEIRILNAQAADPERIYGIWENAHAHSSNITVSNNRFLNQAAGNDPALNLQNAFRVTSHSSLSTTVTYSGNEVQGAQIGLAQYTSSSPPDFSAHQPIQVIGNTFLDNGTGVLIRSQGKDVLRCNRFFGNDKAIGNLGVLADADAVHNWFGCNAGPGFGACDAIDATVSAAPWIALRVAISDPSLNAGQTATVGADLQRDSGGAALSCGVPDGIPTSFGAANGSVSPEETTMTSGLAQTTFTAGGVDGFATVAALADGELQGLFATVTATNTDLSITKTDGRREADPGTVLQYAIVVTNEGPSDVEEAEVADTLPAGLGGCTWTCSSSTGGTCTAAGAGDIDDLVNLPAGAAVTYAMTCTLTAPVSSSVVNTATVTAPAGKVDTNGSNDSAEDVTHSTISIFSDGFESGDVTAWSSSVG